MDSRVDFSPVDASPQSEASKESEAVNDGMAARRKFCVPLFLPSLLQGKSTAVVTPMLPLFIKEDLGGSVADVGAVASAYALAQVASSVPLGFVLARFNHRHSAVCALCVIVLSSYSASLSKSILQLLLVRMISGTAANAWNLSRKVWIAAEVPKEVRGRITGALTGLSRWAGLVGALVSGVVAEYVRTRDVFVVQSGFSFAALLVLLYFQWSVRHLPLPPSVEKKKSKNSLADSSSHSTVLEVFKACWYGLATAGVFVLMLNGCRQTWLILLPLQGSKVGLSKTSIGVVVAVGKFIDGGVGMTLSGSIMDRYGRKSVGVPAMLLMAFAYFLSTWAVDEWSLLLASVTFGLGNGLSGGIASTLSADLAPAWARAQFMGLWKMTTSNGSLLFPLVFGLLAEALGSLDQATYLLQLLGILAAAWLWVVVPETGGDMPQLPSDMTKESLLSC